jgi:hypothetical protein
MTDVRLRAAPWLGPALAATLLGTAESWTFLSTTGTVILMFLAGAERDPAVLRAKWRETGVIGLVSFAAPFLGSAAYAHYVLGWSSEASWLTGVALSTTSAAVVYALMLELGLNSTGFGKAVVAACFVRDLGTVVALGDAAAWADSEAVLPPHLVGMVLAPRRSARGHVIPLSTNTVHTSAKAQRRLPPGDTNNAWAERDTLLLDASRHVLHADEGPACVSALNLFLEQRCRTFFRYREWGLGGAWHQPTAEGQRNPACARAIRILVSRRQTATLVVDR